MSLTTRTYDPGIDFHTESAQWTGDDRRHTDADAMRRRFSIPAYDRSCYDYEEVYPNLVEHYREAPPGEPPTGRYSRLGGTDLLVCEKPGNGKSTLLLNLCIRAMDVNDEAIVWRGSQRRAGWTALAPWTVLCLPASCKGEVDARLEPADASGEPLPVSPADLAREVAWYDDPADLNERILAPGRFHVVYPDPHLRGCQAVYEASEAQVDGVEFAPDHPPQHWWYAYLVARVDRGPHLWTTVVLDEFPELAGSAAAKDGYGSYQKVELLADLWVDFRRKGVSVWAAGHAESEIHEMVRRKVEWRAELTGNPTSAGQVVGVSNVPMNTNLAASYPFDKYLLWTEAAFERRLSWVGLADPIDGELTIELPSVPAGGGP